MKAWEEMQAEGLEANAVPRRIFIHGVRSYGFVAPKNPWKFPKIPGEFLNKKPKKNWRIGTYFLQKNKTAY